MKHTLLLPLMIITATVGLSSVAYADREDIMLLSEVKISLIDAIGVAEKHQGGKAIDASIDDDSFKPSYEVSVVKDNRVFDVQVDAVSGEIVGTREDIDD